MPAPSLAEFALVIVALAPGLLLAFALLNIVRTAWSRRGAQLDRIERRLDELEKRTRSGQG